MFYLKPKMRLRILPQSKLVFLKLLTLLVGALCYSATAHAAYPLARVTNNTEYTVSGQVQYVSVFCNDDNYTVAPGKTWTASSRGVCLIDDITGSTGGAIGKYGESTKITPYHASPATSYSGFQINAFSGSYRIFSADEWKKVSNTKQGKSPGFYFVNKTAWPLTYSLDQVGCLYHGIIPAGEGEKGVRRVDTGAVWFTLKIAIQPDGIDPVSNWDCVKPVAELVGDVALAAVTGGSTAVAKAGGKVIVKTVVKEAMKAGAKKAIKSAAKKIIKDLAKDELGKLLSDAGSVALYGQYAGYEWPFRCDNMPEYHIIGGPVPLKDENGELYLQRGTPFKVTKVNTCGDDMMTGSRRSMESDQSSFSNWPGGAGAGIAEIGDESCVTFYKGTNGGGASLQLCGTANRWIDYINLGKPGTNDFHYKVKSFKCNSGIKSVRLISGKTAIKSASNFACKGGNIVNTTGQFEFATGVGIYRAYCCGEGPKPLTAAQKAARAKKAAAQAQKAAQEKAVAEAQAAAKRAAEQKAFSDRIDAENAALARRWDANAKQLYENCSQRGSVKSVENPGDEATGIRMFNKGSKNINIYLINEQGAEVNHASQDVPVRSIASGPAGDTEYGTPGYWFIATDDSGECVGIGNSVQSNGQFDFNPDLVVPGAHPRKAVSNSVGYDQTGYADDDTNYEDQNVYADDQSGLDDYVDPSKNVDDQYVYEDQDEYSQSDQDDKTDYSGEGPGCEFVGQIASPDDGDIVEVRLENPSDEPMVVYWLDADGEGSNYQGTDEPVVTIAAQSFEMVRTKIGHYLAAGDEESNYCRGIAEIEFNGETISFPAKP